MQLLPCVPIDPHAEWLAADEWFRLASAPATYRYDCHANIVRGVECMVFVSVRETLEFPGRSMGYPTGD